MSHVELHVLMEAEGAVVDEPRLQWSLFQIQTADYLSFLLAAVCMENKDHFSRRVTPVTPIRMFGLCSEACCNTLNE